MVLNVRLFTQLTILMVRWHLISRLLDGAQLKRQIQGRGRIIPDFKRHLVSGPTVPIRWEVPASMPKTQTETTSTSLHQSLWLSLSLRLKLKTKNRPLHRLHLEECSLWRSLCEMKHFKCYWLAQLGRRLWWEFLRL